MHFNVLLVDNNYKDVDDFLLFTKDRVRDIDIVFSSDIEEITKELKLYNLVVIDSKYTRRNEVIKKSNELNIHTLLLTDINDEVLNLVSLMHNVEVIHKPINNEKLIYKIKHYLNILKKDLLLKREQELSNSIINNINYPIFTTDGYRVIFANDYFYKLTDCTSLEQINEKYECIGSLFEKEDGFLTNENNDWLDQCSQENQKVCIKNHLQDKNFFSIQKIYLTHNDTNIIMLNDISHEITHKDELYKMLYTDMLTNLPNRAKLINELQSNKNLRLEAISIIDINSFKEINDFFGHRIGDQILREVGELIANEIKGFTHLKLYKFPADTYCVTNIKNDHEEFTKIIEKIVDRVYKKVFVLNQYEIDTRVTAGISYSNKNNKLITADIALQAAKKRHKDFLVFYDELDKFREYENNMLWTKKLKSAFNNDNIEVFFQPLINNKTMYVDKYECLVRLIDEDGKIISPYFFLDISKKSNQYTKLTKIVIEKSFAKFENLPYEFSVNISYEDIEEPDFLNFIKRMLVKYKVNDRVVFEILEDENVKNYDHLIDFIDEVKQLGCKVAIDDFGSGYSNFEHLLKMNVDYLKIDASLIKNVATDENSYKITKTIIEFAKSLNLKTIAEFVENEEIFNIVKDLGADYSQGYYFSAPIAIPNIDNFKRKDSE